MPRPLLGGAEDDRVRQVLREQVLALGELRPVLLRLLDEPAEPVDPAEHRVALGGAARIHLDATIITIPARITGIPTRPAWVHERERDRERDPDHQEQEPETRERRSFPAPPCAANHLRSLRVVLERGLHLGHACGERVAQVGELHLRLVAEQPVEQLRSYCISSASSSFILRELPVALRTDRLRRAPRS